MLKTGPPEPFLRPETSRVRLPSDVLAYQTARTVRFGNNQGTFAIRVPPVPLKSVAGRLQGVCSRCMMRRVCFGSCVAQNYYRTGSLFSSFWFCEQAEKTDAFPKTRLEATA